MSGLSDDPELQAAVQALGGTLREAGLREAGRLRAGAVANLREGLTRAADLGSPAREFSRALLETLSTVLGWQDEAAAIRDPRAAAQMISVGDASGQIIAAINRGLTGTDLDPPGKALTLTPPAGISVTLTAAQWLRVRGWNTWVPHPTADDGIITRIISDTTGDDTEFSGEFRGARPGPARERAWPLTDGQLTDKLPGWVARQREERTRMEQRHVAELDALDAEDGSNG